VPVAKNAASKNQPEDIFHNENHLHGIELVHLTLNVALITRKHFTWLDIKKNSKIEI